MSLIGYQEDVACDAANPLYYINYNTGGTKTCDFRGYKYEFDTAQFYCLDNTTTYSNLNARVINYEVRIFPTDAIYIADYNKMECLAPGNNNAVLAYTGGATPVAQCKRMSVNGWEIFNALNNPRVVSWGEDDANYGSSNQALFINLNAKDCRTTNAAGANIGTFDEASGTCINGGTKTAFVGYNAPTWAEFNNYFSANSGIELIYIF